MQHLPGSPREDHQHSGEIEKRKPNLPVPHPPLSFASSSSSLVLLFLRRSTEIEVLPRQYRHLSTHQDHSNAGDGTCPLQI